MAEAEGGGLIFLVLLFCEVKRPQHPRLSCVWASLNFGSTLFTYTIYGQ